MRSRLSRRAFAILAVGAVLTGGGVYGYGQLASNPGTTPGGGANQTAANLFVGANGSCTRYDPATGSIPTSGDQCGSVASAYTNAQAGDTVWVLPGSYSNDTISFSSSVSQPTSKTVDDANDCNATGQCVYVTPQPGQAANVSGGMQFIANHTPDHLYYQGFQNYCPEIKESSFGSYTGFGTDLTLDGMTSEADCQGQIDGPWHYVRILDSTFTRACMHGSAAGFFIGANEDAHEATSHTHAPDHVLLSGDHWSQYNVDCDSTDHEDCIHWYVATYTTIQNSTFDNCWDSSILAEGLDETDYAEYDIIQNNWFGPTQLDTNNCCLRGAGGPTESCATETFDNWIIRFNSSVTYFMNKGCNILNNVEFIGNIGLIDQTGCSATYDGSRTNVTWAYNLAGNICGATDVGSQSNTTVKFENTTAGSLNLHIQAGSSAIGAVAGAQTDGCSSIGVDKDGIARPSPCAAGANEP